MSIAKQVDILSQTERAPVVFDDALGKFTVERETLAEMLEARYRVGLYPFDLMPEADIALRWRDSGGLMGRVRWTQTKAELGVKKVREALSQ